MVVLFRTSFQPTIYLAKACSLATLFRAICLIIKFGGPILICYFYLDYSPGYTFDFEHPTVYPGNIVSFVARDIKDLYIFSDINSDNGVLSQLPDHSTIFQTIPHYNGSTLDYWTIKAKILDQKASNISYISILFNFTVHLRKWANCTIESIGSFTHSFPSNVNRVSVFGDLILEQNEILTFRHEYNESLSDLHSYSMHSDILENQNNLSYFFYTEWNEPIVKYGFWYSFELDLRIYVRDVKVWHTIPLVSSIQSIITLYLSTVILTSLIFDNFQGWVFRKGYIKSWAHAQCEQSTEVSKFI